MAVMIHDTTGTQTDSVAPLSRKKLRQLMPGNRNNLTTGALKNPKNPFHIADRERGLKAVSVCAQKTADRRKKKLKKERRKAEKVSKTA